MTPGWILIAAPPGSGMREPVMAGLIARGGQAATSEDGGYMAAIPIRAPRRAANDR